MARLVEIKLIVASIVYLLMIAYLTWPRPGDNWLF